MRRRSTGIASSCTIVPRSVTAPPRHHTPNKLLGVRTEPSALLSTPPPKGGGEVSRRSRDGEGDNGAGYGSEGGAAAELGIESGALKNNIIQNQCVN